MRGAQSALRKLHAIPRSGGAFFAACIVSAALPGCGGSQSNAPLAPQSFNNGVHTASADSGTAGSTAVFDAGAPPDSGTAVCVPGSLSVPYSLKDPCNQVMSSCSLMGSLSISTCQSDGTWGLPCVCQNTLGAGFGGSGGTGMLGTGGSF